MILPRIAWSGRDDEDVISTWCNIIKDCIPKQFRSNWVAADNPRTASWAG